MLLIFQPQILCNPNPELTKPQNRKLKCMIVLHGKPFTSITVVLVIHLNRSKLNDQGKESIKTCYMIHLWSISQSAIAFVTAYQNYGIIFLLYSSERTTPNTYRAFLRRPASIPSTQPEIIANNVFKNNTVPYEKQFDLMSFNQSYEILPTPHLIKSATP